MSVTITPDADLIAALEGRIIGYEIVVIADDGAFMTAHRDSRRDAIDRAIIFTFDRVLNEPDGWKLGTGLSRMAAHGNVNHLEECGVSVSIFPVTDV